MASENKPQNNQGFKARLKSFLNNNQFVVYLIIFILLIIIYLIASSSYFFPELNKEEITVSAIMSDNKSYATKNYVEAMEVAAIDNNYNISISYPIHPYNASEQVKLLEREVEKGSDYIIINPISLPLLEKVDTASSEVIVLAGTNKDIASKQVSSNYEEISADFIDLLNHAVAKDKAKQELSIFISSKTTNKEEELLELVSTAYKDKYKQEANIVRLNYDRSLENLLKSYAGGSFLALDADALNYLASIKANASYLDTTYLMGMGHNPKVVQYLKSGYIDTFIAEDYYNLAYKAIESIGSDEDKLELDHRIINRSNVDSFTNEIYLFPLFY